MKYIVDEEILKNLISMDIIANGVHDLAYEAGEDKVQKAISREIRTFLQDVAHVDEQVIPDEDIEQLSATDAAEMVIGMFSPVPEHGVVVDEDTLKNLIDRDMQLTSLEVGGVDNWEWYGDSWMDYWREQRDRLYENKRDFLREVADERGWTLDEIMGEYINCTAPNEDGTIDIVGESSTDEWIDVVQEALNRLYFDEIAH